MGGLGTTTATTNRSEDRPVEALDVVFSQDRIIGDLLDMWRRASEQLSHGEDVDLRWRRGSDVKLLLQHLAVREAAKEALVRRLREAGQDELGAKLDGDGIWRRELLAALDELARGQQAISLNFPEIDATVTDLGSVFDHEREADKACLSEAAALLGPRGKRGLPKARSVQMQSVTHPNPVPRWYDRVRLIKVFHAFYDHMRTAPSGVANPGVDGAREHLPGPES